MKTTIIPAQITTVEDKIAGNLSFMQLLILMIPVLSGLVIYAFIPQPMAISISKGIAFGIILLACLLLIIRIKGRLVINWLILITRYNLRPQYYLFNKNSSQFRALEPIPVQNTKSISQASPTKSVRKPSVDLNVFNHFLNNSKRSIRVIPSNKGGFNVAIK